MQNALWHLLDNLVCVRDRLDNGKLMSWVVAMSPSVCCKTIVEKKVALVAAVVVLAVVFELMAQH